MALSDLFDSDPRSKADMRRELEEQLRRINQLDSNLRQSKLDLLASTNREHEKDSHIISLSAAKRSQKAAADQEQKDSKAEITQLKAANRNIKAAAEQDQLTINEITRKLEIADRETNKWKTRYKNVEGTIEELTAKNLDLEKEKKKNAKFQRYILGRKNILVAKLDEEKLLRLNAAKLVQKRYKKLSMTFEILRKKIRENLNESPLIDSQKSPRLDEIKKLKNDLDAAEMEIKHRARGDNIELWILKNNIRETENIFKVIPFEADNLIFKLKKLIGEDNKKQISELNHNNQINYDHSKLLEKYRALPATEEFADFENLVRVVINSFREIYFFVSKPIHDLRKSIIKAQGKITSLELDNESLTHQNQGLQSELSDLANNLETEHEKRKLLDSIIDLHDAEKDSFQDQLNELKEQLGIERKKVVTLSLSKGRNQQDQNSELEENLTDSPFLNERILRWMLEGALPELRNIENGYLSSSGELPWKHVTLSHVLRDLNYEFYKLPHSTLPLVIVGKKYWNRDLLLEQINARSGQELRIYSQEMFIAMLITGRDPFDADDPALLDAFALGHPALQFLMSLPKPWPIVSDDETIEIISADSSDFGVSESPLHLLGYKVGTTSGLSQADRRQILTSFFNAGEIEFSDDSAVVYREKWGRNSSAQRLYRMAIHIKSMADGRVGKDWRKPQARIDWISDLQWLKATYFSEFSHRFTWPNTSIN
jgi:hypothetical protein